MSCITQQKIKVFVIHYTKLTNRKSHIIRQFNTHNITDYEFIEKYDKEDLQDCDKVFFNTGFKESMMSFINKTFYVYRLISENYESALILEDDVILSNNFTAILNEYMTQLPKDYDMLFIGNGCNLHIEPHKIVPRKYIYERGVHATNWGGQGATRCTDSYIVSKKCAIKLCEYIKNLSNKITLPGDLWLNVAARENNLKVYWAEPTIITQGTENGLFKSSH